MPANLYEFDSFRVEVASRRLLKDGEVVPLSSRAFDVLVELIKNNGEIVSQEDLMNAVWHDQAVEPNNLSQAIKQLRQALGENAKDPKYIQTIPRQGFKFILPKNNQNFPVAEKSESQTPPDNRQFLPDEQKKAASKEKSFWTKAAILGIAIIGGIAAIYFWQSSRPTSALGVKNITVLPFQNLSSQGDREGLGLGIADILITKLGNIQQINIQPTSAVTKFNQKDRNIYEIAEQLKVDAVLDGSFQREGERLRVNAQLVDVKNKTVLWSGTFVEKSDDLFAIQEQIAENIADFLQLELTSDEKRFLAQRYTNNPEAYRLYLKARELYFTQDADNILHSRALYEKAIETDKNFALAYVGLALTYSSFRGAISPKQAYEKMKMLCREALRIDENIGEAHGILALALWRGGWNWGEAEFHFKRANQLSPKYPLAYVLYSLLLIGQERFDEALTVIESGQDKLPNHSNFFWAKATILTYSKQYDKAEQIYLEILKQKNLDSQTLTGLGILYTYQNRYDEALELFLKVKVLETAFPENPLFLLGVVYGKTGQTEKAREMLAELHKLAEKRPGVWGGIANVYIALGEKDKAFEYMEKSIKEREHFGYLLKVNPFYDPLRDDPRFEELLRRVNLAA